MRQSDPDVRATGFYRRLGWRRSGVMMGGDEVLRLSRADAAGDGSGRGGASSTGTA